MDIEDASRVITAHPLFLSFRKILDSLLVDDPQTLSKLADKERFFYISRQVMPAVEFNGLQKVYFTSVPANQLKDIASAELQYNEDTRRNVEAEIAHLNQENCAKINQLLDRMKAVSDKCEEALAAINVLMNRIIEVRSVSAQEHILRHARIKRPFQRLDSDLYTSIDSTLQKKSVKEAELPVLFSAQFTQRKPELKMDISRQSGSGEENSLDEQSSKDRYLQSKFDKFPRHAQRILRDWFDAHFEYPYPSKLEKKELCTQCNISMHQLNQWFTNSRLRIWKPQQKNRSNSSKPAIQQQTDLPALADAKISSPPRFVPTETVPTGVPTISQPVITTGLPPFYETRSPPSQAIANYQIHPFPYGVPTSFPFVPYGYWYPHEPYQSVPPLSVMTDYEDARMYSPEQVPLVSHRTPVPFGNSPSRPSTSGVPVSEAQLVVSSMSVSSSGFSSSKTGTSTASHSTIVMPQYLPSSRSDQPNPNKILPRR